MHDAWRTAPDRAPGFSGSLIQGITGYLRQVGHFSVYSVARIILRRLRSARVDAAVRTHRM
jgi:hypothetical protein